MVPKRGCVEVCGAGGAVVVDGGHRCRVVAAVAELNLMETHSRCIL